MPTFMTKNSHFAIECVCMDSCNIYIDSSLVDVVDVVVGQRRKKEEKHQFFASTNTFGDTSIVFALTNLQWLA